LESAVETIEESITVEGIDAQLYELPADAVDGDREEEFIVESEDEHGNAVFVNKRLDYQLRPSALRDMCMYTYFSKFRKEKVSDKENHLYNVEETTETEEARTHGRSRNDRYLFQPSHPQYHVQLIMRRTYDVIPVLSGPSIPRQDREETKERYARAILCLFRPWTTVVDLCRVNQTWHEALLEHQPSFDAESNRIISNIQLLHECRKDRDNDLFQMVNQPVLAEKPPRFSSLNDSMIDETEEALAQLTSTLEHHPSLFEDYMAHDE
jgi:hypothetical protein